MWITRNPCVSSAPSPHLGGCPGGDAEHRGYFVEKFEQLDNPENFRKWAFGVARFEVLSYRRDKARDRHVFSEELLLQLAGEAEKISEQTIDEIRIKKMPK